MRTAFKKIGLPSLWVFALLAAFSCVEKSPLAQTAAAPAPVTPPAAGGGDTISNLATSAMNVAPTAAPAAVTGTPAAAPAPMPVPTPPAVDSANDDKGTTLEDEESNVPKSVNAVIKHLNKESENITLNDLNSARQAIAKIETLIELEKKLGELEKVQKERESKSAAAVPASMLMPAAVASPPVDTTRFAPPPVSMMGDIDIDRIVGGAGEYKAVVKTADGSSKTMAIGDTLPDGGVVSKISGSGMEIMHGDTKQTIHVKNVDMVFGVAP
jgi:hypothetical protein